MFVCASSHEWNESENEDSIRGSSNAVGTESNTNSSDSSNKTPSNNPSASVYTNTFNSNSETKRGSSANQNTNFSAPLEDPGAIDPKTGLSLGTLQIIYGLSPCKRQLLINYRRLLRSPTIRLQFYRDLYQRYQAEHVATGCGEGGEKIMLGFKERAVLLGDPFFRAKVKKLMRRQPMGVAINGPSRYPNDITMDNTQPLQNTLTITKQY